MIRAGISKLMSWSGTSQALLSLRRMDPVPWLPVLTYHRVAKLPADDGLDGGTIDATPEQFDRQVALLAERFRFIGVDDIMRYLGGRPLPPNPIMLSFDDGYLDCHSRALPILQRHGAKATFFVATASVERRTMFWWDMVSLLVGRCPHEEIELTYPFLIRFDLRQDRTAVMNAVRGLVKSYVGLDLERFLPHLAEACGTAIGAEEERAIVERTVMTWDHVQELAAAGMDVQSHTRTHRVLHTLSPRELAEELVGSRVDLETVIGRPVRALAFPVGYSVNRLPYVYDALREAGYTAAFTNQTGVNHTWRAPHPYDLRRIAMCTSYDDTFFEGMMALPYLVFGQRSRCVVPERSLASTRSTGISGMRRRDDAPEPPHTATRPDVPA